MMRCGSRGIWREWPSKMIRVADRGLREGMLMGLMDRKQTIRALPETETAPDKEPLDIEHMAKDQNHDG